MPGPQTLLSVSEDSLGPAIHTRTAAPVRCYDLIPRPGSCLGGTPASTLRSGATSL